MKSIKLFTRIVLISAFVMSTLARAASPEQSTIVCLGDSITRAGYPAELEKLLQNARVINAGVNGNNSREGLARLEKDVLAHKPDVVVLFFGTNDGRVDAPKKHVQIAEYEKNLSTIVQRCQESGANVVLGTMPPIDPEPYFTRHVKADFDAIGGLEKQIRDYRAAALRVGKSKKIPVVDLNQLLLNEKNWRSPDGVHPTEEGNKIIARLFAKEIKPLINSSRSRIDAGTKPVPAGK